LLTYSGDLLRHWIIQAFNFRVLYSLFYFMSMVGILYPALPLYICILLEFTAKIAAE